MLQMLNFSNCSHIILHQVHQVVENALFTILFLIYIICSRYMRRNALCLRHMSRTLWVSRNVWKPAVRLFLGMGRIRIELRKGRRCESRK